MQDFIQLRVDGLCVAMLRTLYDERHGPGCQSSHRVPLESFRLEHIPKGAVDNEHEECERAGRINTEASQQMPDWRPSSSAVLAHRYQSSSASRFTAGATGFLNFSQSAVRPFGARVTTPPVTSPTQAIAASSLRTAPLRPQASPRAHRYAGQAAFRGCRTASTTSSEVRRRRE